MTDARTKLLEHFDDEVHHKLKLRDNEIKSQLSRYGEWLWRLSCIELGEAATFDFRARAFRLNSIPPELPAVPVGVYRLVTEKAAEGDIHFRLGHPLAEALIQRAKGRTIAPAQVEFHYEHYDGKASVIEQLRGKSGWLRLVCLSVTALEVDDTLVFCGYSDGGDPIDGEIGEKLLAVPGTVGAAITVPVDEDAALDETTRRRAGRRALCGHEPQPTLLRSRNGEAGALGRGPEAGLEPPD